MEFLLMESKAAISLNDSYIAIIWRHLSVSLILLLFMIEERSPTLLPILSNRQTFG